MQGGPTTLHIDTLPLAQSHLGEGAQECVCIHTEHTGALTQAHTVDTHTHTGVYIHTQIHTQFCHEQWARRTGAYTRTHREVDICRQSHPSAHKVSTHACTHAEFLTGNKTSHNLKATGIPSP